MLPFRSFLLAACTLASAFTASAGAGLPVFFEANRGQADTEAQFIARAGDYRVVLGPTRASYQSAGGALDMTWPGANVSPQITGEGLSAGRSHYFLGSKPTGWLTGIEQFERVRYTRIYDGIDLVFYDRGGRLEYDFVVEPGADPDQVVLCFGGMTALTVDDEGALVFDLGGPTLRQLRPTVYQEIDGRREGRGRERKKARGGAWTIPRA